MKPFFGAPGARPPHAWIGPMRSPTRPHPSHATQKLKHSIQRKKKPIASRKEQQTRKDTKLSHPTHTKEIIKQKK